MKLRPGDLFRIPREGRKQFMVREVEGDIVHAFELEGAGLRGKARSFLAEECIPIQRQAG